MSLSLLLVDDDVEYCQLLSKVLRQAGAEIVICHNGRIALEETSKRHFDLIFLDVAMPEMDGFAALHQLRKISDTPVIMLTSRIASSDKVQGLDGGADDYICKPCEPDELLSRIRAVLRRARKTGGPSQSYVIGTHRFDMKTRELTCEGHPVRLTSLEGELLSMLLQARAKVVKREAISMALQDRALDVFDRSLDVHISRLRSKLGADSVAIQTVRGVGYLIATAVEEA